MYKIHHMTRFLLRALCLAIVCLGVQHAAAISADVPITNRTLIDVSKRVRPAVVRIEITIPAPQGVANGDTERDWSDILPRLFEELPEDHPDIGGDEITLTAASGALISPEGHIITVYHLIDEARRANIKVVLEDGREFTGDKVKIIGTEDISDMAVLKIEGENLPHIEWGDSELLEVGEWVMAVGNPLDLNSSVSQGIISALGRDIGNKPIEKLLQTTAVINPGNSGGPLVNMNGEIIGINTAIASRTGLWYGIGFAVPSAEARRVATDLIERGRVSRGFLGITMQNISDDIGKWYDGKKQPEGVIVLATVPESAAQKAGVLTYDIVTKVNGTDIRSTFDLLRQVASITAGKPITIALLRKQGRDLIAHEFNLTLDERPSDRELNQRGNEFGMVPRAGNSEVFKDFGLGLSAVAEDFATTQPGVVVTEIADGSPARRAGLMPNDLVTEINRQPMRSLKDAGKQLNGKDKEPILILYKRFGNLQLTVIELEGE